ncbi:MAG: porin family protein [Candidatus Latescibacteria bacterium]|nr:porin family protein [Candidatus Latescibacterota bacterium]
MRNVIVVFAVLFSVLACTGARAQDHPSDQGLNLALRLSAGEFRATDAGSNEKVSDVGGGLALTLGYDFNPVFGLKMELSGNGYSSLAPGLDAGIGSLSLLMQYRFLPDHFARPYLRAGLGGYTLEFSDALGNVTASGGGVPLGAGVEFGIARHVSLGVDVTYHIIGYEEVTLESSGVGLTYDIDADGSQISFSLVTLFYF